MPSSLLRWLALAIFLAALAVSTWHRRRARRDGGTIPRRSEPAGLIAGRLLVALPLFGVVVAWLANPRWMAWAALDLPPWAGWLGVALGLLVVPTLDRVLAALGPNVSETVLTKPDHRLVTHGPYRRVRHPLYTTGIALFLSLALIAANAFLLAWTLVALLAIRLVVVPREEAELEARFGEEYRRYRARTGALLPRVGRGRRGG